jgi:hypothetical protein
MPERRSHNRVRSLLGARIVFNNRLSSLDCLIRNLSDTGARLIVSDAVSVPDEFELYLPQRNRTYRAQVRWRTATEFGVHFPAGEPTAPEPIDVSIRLRRLEAEKAALHARVVQLSSAE